MRKGLHPQMQWISYVTQSGRLINIMMTKVNHTGKVYHMRAKRQMAQSLGQIAKFKRRYEQEAPEENQDKLCTTWASENSVQQLWLLQDDDEFCRDGDWLKFDLV
ncbi:uncharacterized protein [Triticum aestivum]|uniref:uncharacterized protein n=1 Tax=Triticum aestivum TaxID=4565 RepID=UPI00084375BB|nr:uncharacterized protein LOC123112535 [Triticum aestivum]